MNRYGLRVPYQARLELEGRSPSNQPPLPLSPSAEGRNTFAIRAKCTGEESEMGSCGLIKIVKTMNVLRYHNHINLLHRRNCY